MNYRSKTFEVVVFYKLLLEIKSSGRERGIRTPGGITLTGFQDRHVQPLRHLPTIKVVKFNGGATQIRTGDNSFAGYGLTTWRWRHI